MRSLQHRIQARPDLAYGLLQDLNEPDLFVDVKLGCGDVL